jgi:hypothetical protein
MDVNYQCLRLLGFHHFRGSDVAQAVFLATSFVNQGRRVGLELGASDQHSDTASAGRIARCSFKGLKTARLDCRRLVRGLAFKESKRPH